MAVRPRRRRRDDDQQQQQQQEVVVVVQATYGGSARWLAGYCCLLLACGALLDRPALAGAAKGIGTWHLCVLYHLYASSADRGHERDRIVCIYLCGPPPSAGTLIPLRGDDY